MILTWMRTWLTRKANVTTVQKMTNHGEWFAVFGATTGWATWLHGVLDPVLLILSVLLTLISLFLVVPKFVAQIKKWFD